jgi:alkylation response protein AidB-like acyl-CoA dehydrogenase
MDFKDSPEQAAFRQSVRQVLDRCWPERLRDSFWMSVSYALRLDEEVAAARETYRKEFASRGWITPAWPRQYGGAGLSIMEQFIFNYEVARARAPSLSGIGPGYAGPTIITFGTDDQKARFLPGIVDGSEYWCQLFSEPGAGSDLASLTTRAVRDGDSFVVNGQKIWTSGGHLAKYGILLARTDPGAPKHRGISFFILDMKSPGVTVQPLINIAGTHEFNQVFFDDVRVPRENLVGEENRGWYVGVGTLDFERSSVGSAVTEQHMVKALARAARELPVSALRHNPMVRYELAERYIESEVALMLSLQVIQVQAAGRIPNAEASASKLYTKELDQRIARTALKVLGLYAQVGAGSPHAQLGGFFHYYYPRSISFTIGGGTSEIQRNIIAQRGLGLPRD